MSNSQLTQVVDAAVTHLTAQSLSQTFSVSRTYLPDFEREELSSAEITIYPTAEQLTVIARGENQHVFTLAMVIRIPVTPAEDPDISSSLKFAEEVGESLDRQTMAGAAYLGATIEPVFDIELLNENHEFLQVVQLNYLKVR